MILRRQFLIGLGAALALSACAAQGPSVGRDAGALNVRAVTLDVSELQSGVEGRNTTVTMAQVKRDLETALSASLAQSSDPAGTPVRVTVEVSEVHLTSRVSAAVAGGASFVEGLVSVSELETDRQVLAPTTIKGSSETLRLPGVIGIVTSPSAENDYLETISGFTETVKNALFGEDT